MVCPALSECRVGDGLVIGATTLYMWGLWGFLSEWVKTWGGEEVGSGDGGEVPVGGEAIRDKHIE
jgi:hypothetical protein